MIASYTLDQINSPLTSGFKTLELSDTSSATFMTEGRSLMTEEIHQRRANINSVQFPLSADECDLEATSDVVIA